MQPIFRSPLPDISISIHQLEFCNFDIDINIHRYTKLHNLLFGRAYKVLLPWNNGNRDPK